ncbi:MAG TPA: C40 family peptidase [Candidatus Avacidaminococcus intestinavium]|uniref:C40 family peptidase n=1 Tax=Candidatus Avacidaminococcus intestinavium TaxID=2840684 RepID=A0A9D1MQR9_9FIRM|nr:C40 family peptidase [Candidatus Avacidaminococcus intestinavium]
MVMLVFCFLIIPTTSVFANFQSGDDGAEVVELQERLIQLGYSLSAADGAFGDETLAAVKQFQQDNGMEADGIVGTQTYYAMFKRDLPPSRSGRTSTVRNLISSAFKYIGVPYVFGGTSPWGFDCSGYTQYVFASVGISLPRTADSQYYNYKRIAMKNLRPGDLVFFETYEPGPSHVGIYLGNGEFIHAGSSTGVTVSALGGYYWGERYLGAVRII